MESPQPVLRSVLGQIDWWWVALYRHRVQGMTDEEFVWSPVDECWTIHPQAEGVTHIDFEWPPPRPAPFTTIAWRVAHIGLMLADRTHRYFPDHAPDPWEFPPHTFTLPFPTSAAGALAFVERWWHGWRRGLEAGGEATLWAPYGGVEGDYPEMQLAADDPFLNMVLHTHRELIHHGAEIALLRDLYAAQHR